MGDTISPIDPRHTALLVMDYQAGIIGSFPEAEAEALLTRTAAAITSVRRQGGVVGFVRVAFEDADYDAFGPTSRMGARVAGSGRAFHADSPTTAIHERLAPHSGDIVVRKTRVGAFSTTDLDAQLRARGITSLLIAGISTSGVVLSTVRDADDRDYELFVLADACADRDPEVHAFLTERIFPHHMAVIATTDLDRLLS